MEHVGCTVTLAVGAGGVETELIVNALVGAEVQGPSFVTVQV